VAPTHFRLQGETAEPLMSPVALDAALVEATEMCPTSAITLLGPTGDVIASGERTLFEPHPVQRIELRAREELIHATRSSTDELCKGCRIAVRIDIDDH